MTANEVKFGSFRDPSGFIFLRNGLILRQVNLFYKENYELFMKSGLYDYLSNNDMLVAHSETDTEGLNPAICYKVIKPDLIPFISYPYEWCFSQLKDAALLTLEIQEKALEYDMSLKDSSAFNIQFRHSKPIFIDTLSFEKYQKGRPWVAYKQFCQHFLAPLVLMSYKDASLGQLLKFHLDGIPLDLASKLLPIGTRLNFSMLAHIHLHAKAQSYYSGKNTNIEKSFSKNAFMVLIESLKTLIKNLKWRASNTEWSNYYQETNYSTTAFSHKLYLVSELLDQIKPETVWDLGANTGIYSRVAAGKDALVISFDRDPVAVELNYLQCKKNDYNSILPMLMDLTNPSSNLGWDNNERMSLEQRGLADTALVLALVHHLAISNNLPFTEIAKFLCKICKSLIIEFIPKEDSQVKRLLQNREEIFFNYNRSDFEAAFSDYFVIKHSDEICDSRRSIYLMERKQL